MMWTKDYPHRSGFYWYRDDDTGYVNVLKVAKCNDCLVIDWEIGLYEDFSMYNFSYSNVRILPPKD